MNKIIYVVIALCFWSCHIIHPDSKKCSDTKKIENEKAAECKSFEPYDGKVSFVNNDFYKYYESEEAAIILELSENDAESKLIYSELLGRGILEGSMFFQINFKPQSPIEISGVEEIIEKKYIVRIGKIIEEENNIDSLYIKRIKLTISYHQFDDYQDHVLLELTNPNASKNMTFREFIKDSKVSCLKYLYSDI